MHVDFILSASHKTHSASLVTEDEDVNQPFEIGS